MKKLKFVLPLIALPIVSFGTISCANQRSEGKITLVGYTDASSVGIDGKDYWLAAEPAVTTKIKKQNLNNVGNLQSLYGEHGFNQAVLVCKKSLLTTNPAYLNQVQQFLMTNYSFISEPSNLTTIINTINDNLTEGKIETLTLNNTTTQTLINCNAKYVSQLTDMKTYVDFLEKAIEINSDIQRPSNAFEFYNGFPSESNVTNDDEYKIICPDGAPAVGLANLMCNKDSLINKTSFEIIDPTLVMQKIGQNKPALAVLPSNLATKLYNEYDNEYVWLSTVTWGNLYILSKNFNEQITKDNLATQLNGKNMGVLQLNSVPGIVLKIILKENNIDYAE